MYATSSCISTSLIVLTVRPGYAVRLIQTRWRAFVRRRNETIQIFQGKERRSLIVSHCCTLNVLLVLHICALHVRTIVCAYYTMYMCMCDFHRLDNEDFLMLVLSCWRESCRILSWKTPHFSLHHLRYTYIRHTK